MSFICANFDARSLGGHFLSCISKKNFAAKYLIHHWRSNYHLNSILVVLEPEKIEGKNGAKQFYSFVPPKT